MSQDGHFADAAGGMEADLFRFESELSPRERDLVNALRVFLDRHVRPIADEYWSRGESPRHLLPRFGELGVLGLGFAETQPFDSSALCRGWLTMEIARVDPSTGTLVGVHKGLAMTSIAMAGSEAQRAELLPRMARGEIVGAFGLTEPEHGSDVAGGLATTARRDAGTWVIDGAKRWIGNGTFADVLVIWARDVEDGAVKGFLIRPPSEGLRAHRIAGKQSLRGVENADIELRSVVVPESDRLPGVRGFRDVAAILERSRLEVAWQAVGVAVGAYERARGYALERRQFGRPIGSFQLVQQKLADSLTAVTASLAMCARAAALQERGELRDPHSAMVKAFASARARQVVAWAREILGGNGIQLDHGVARFFADAEAIYTFEGTYDISSLIVGREITGISAFV